MLLRFICAAILFLGVAQIGSTQVLQSPILTIDSERFYRDSAFGQSVLREIERRESTLNEENRVLQAELEAEELDELAEKLGSYSNQRYYRLPGLRYLKFMIKYTGNKKTKLNLFSTYFIDEFEKKYAPFGIKDYRKNYTSSSYSRFDYDVFLHDSYSALLLFV